ncbi:CAP domain-containing protein [Neotabrizicola sp. VNH66]|uniref:CAP domain-containing protein n=1 Tax=Neotabrizicola sp. VNH66 TaxID=3400918 RepID=UPI003C086A12
MTLSAEEQFALELINRARLDPRAEAARLGIDLNAGLAPGTLDGASRQILAPNALLEQAAEGHGQWMLDTGTFSHTGAGGSGPYDRMVAAGYVFSGHWGAAENIASLSGPAAGADALAMLRQHLDTLFRSPGHRLNLLDGTYRELGLAQVIGYSPNGRTVTSMLVEDFARSGTGLFLTGVAYSDRDGDGFYSLGEAVAGMRIFTATAQTASHEAGGYAMQLSPGSGLTAVLIETGAHQLRLSVRIDGQNVKLDVVDGTTVRVSADTVLHSGIREAELLGLRDLSLIGAEGDEVLRGNAGSNILRGEGGNDTIYGGSGHDNIGGGGGDDLIYGVSGSNVIWAGAGNDTVQGGSGSDTVYGGAGVNQLFGNDGNDLIYTSPGGGLTGGGAGNDTIYGAEGADTLYLGFGDDFAGGGGGNDLIFGGAGNNRIYGGTGDDTIVAGTGRDVMTGSPGADHFIFNSAAHIGIGAARDVITDFETGLDRIDLRALGTSLSTTGGLTGGGTASFYYYAAGGLLIGDQNGDGMPDWVIELQNRPAVFGAGDVLL